MFYLFAVTYFPCDVNSCWLINVITLIDFRRQVYCKWSTCGYFEIKLSVLICQNVRPVILSLLKDAQRASLYKLHVRSAFSLCKADHFLNIYNVFKLTRGRDVSMRCKKIHCRVETDAFQCSENNGKILYLAR